MKYNIGDLLVPKHGKSIILVLKSKDEYVRVERYDRQSGKLIQSVYRVVEVENYCVNDIWTHYPVKE